MGKIYGNAISLGQTIGFTQNAPLDDRVAVENAADLANLKAYEGLITYVRSEDKYYSYRQGQWHEGLPGQSHEDKTPHRFMSKQAYENLDTIEPNVLYCLYEDSGEIEQITIPLNYSIGLNELPYQVPNGEGYVIVGTNTILSEDESPKSFQAQLIDPIATEWADGTVSNKYFTITVNVPSPEPTDWTFGNNFPIIFGTSWAFGDNFPIIFKTSN